MFPTFLKGTANQKNKYLTSSHLKKPMSYILYLEKNNLYRYAMSKFLLTGGFK